MPANPPFWVMQRQARIEQVNDETIRLAAPNLPTCELAVAREAPDAGYRAAVYQLSSSGGERDLIAASAELLPDENAAWQLAFELYRNQVVV